jgi:hypothetical protein
MNFLVLPDGVSITELFEKREQLIDEHGWPNDGLDYPQHAHPKRIGVPDIINRRPEKPQSVKGSG